MEQEREGVSHVFFRNLLSVLSGIVSVLNQNDGLVWKSCCIQLHRNFCFYFITNNQRDAAL